MGPSWFCFISGRAEVYTSAAEGFYFISGLVLGIISSRRDLGEATQSILRRARGLGLSCPEDVVGADRVRGDLRDRNLLPRPNGRAVRGRVPPANVADAVRRGIGPWAPSRPREGLGAFCPARARRVAVLRGRWTTVDMLPRGAKPSGRP